MSDTRPVRYSTHYTGRKGAAWAQGTGESTRSLVIALDHDDVLLMHRALRMYSEVLSGIDREFPNPDQRSMARRAMDLSEHARAANAARDWIETEKGITS
jgi:hypothetical protein